jgi:2-polyprenyl-3-methyl-5-hydroxy-6-metoxy-1,4-benzoquinol methylase
MDAPEVEPLAHREALAGLRRINEVSGAVEQVAAPVRAFARRAGLARIGLLDVGCGGGDVPVGVARLLKKAGVEVALTLMDKSETALMEAGALARSAGVENVGAQGEAPEGLPRVAGGFDVITNSLFLHHLGENEVVATLAAMKDRLREGGLLVISDLRRCGAGWMAAWAGCRVLSRSPLVRHDGPVSVAAAWTREELRAMAVKAGMREARVARAWPWRMLLTWEKGAAC